MTYGYVTPTGGFTLEIWFKRTLTAPSSFTLFSQQTQNRAVSNNVNPSINGRHFMVYLQATGELSVDFRKESDNTQLYWYVGSTQYGTDGEWHFFAVKLQASDKRTFKVWVDGNLETTQVLSAVPDWKAGTLAIGASYAPYLGNFGDGLFEGSLAYAAVWDEELTDSKIQEHYTAGNGGTIFYGDDEVTRLGRIYDYCGVPLPSRQFDPAVTTLQGIQVAGQNGLTKTTETAKDASGLVFADGQAVMVYQNKRHRYNRPISVTLTEDTASAPDVGMECSTDDTKVYNDIRAQRSYGGSARIRNKASMYEYGQKVYDLTLSITSDDEMRNAGSWVAERYGEDRLRISGVTLSAESSDVIEGLVATIKIGDRIAFDDLPENVPKNYMEFIVEGISVNADFKGRTWSLGLELSPAELWNVMQVGVSTLGDGSRIAF